MENVWVFFLNSTSKLGEIPLILSSVKDFDMFTQNILFTQKVHSKSTSYYS